ncbi:MAG: hypothetical protein ABL963_03720 [Longimicrobiales bacterium]
MSLRLVYGAALAAAFVLNPRAAHAQTTTDVHGLRDRVAQELFVFGSCGEPLCLDVTNAHGDHFKPLLASGNQAVLAFLTQSIGESTQRVPLSATSSGATFSVIGGVPVRTSVSAGPIFGERTQTLGRGRLFVGASVTGIEFSSLNGAPLDNIGLTFAHSNEAPSDTLGNPSFENDLMELQLQMAVNVMVGTISVTAGVTDFLDVGVAVPLVRTQVSGRSDAQFLPFGSSALHRFGGTDTDPILRATATMEGSASGLGDVAARMKLNLGQGARMGAALLAEVRFATGKEEDLLGTGSTQFRAVGLYSAQFGTFSPHLNVGYAMRSSEDQNDAFLVALAADNLLSDWATLAIGVDSELQVGDNKFVLPSEIVLQDPFLRRIPATNVPNKSGDLIRASIGAKFTVRGGTVLVVNGLFPLREVGLQPDFIWTVGVDFPF